MTPENHHQQNILIVDDTPSTISTVRTVLKEHGYTVFVATSGEVALETAELSRPDLILLDILMPGMDGYDTCKHLKVRETTKDIPIIFMTVVTETFDKVKGFQLGAVDYITKPVEPEELLARVKTHLSIYRQQREIQEMNRTLEEKVATRTKELSRTNEALKEEIEERRRTAEALQDSEERYHGLFEDSPISLWEEDFSHVKEYLDDLRVSGITDFRAHFQSHPEAVIHCAGLVKLLDVNQATLVLLGAKAKQELLTGLPRIFTEESLEVFREELITLAEGGQRFESEAVQRALNGEEKLVVLHLRVAPGYEDSLGKVLVSLLDVTERKRAEEELKKHRDHLEELVKERTTELAAAKERADEARGAAEAANRAKSVFLANMSHELRTPLNAILGYAQLLKREKTLTEKQRDQLNTIHSSGEYLLTLISDLLDLTRIETQRMAVDVHPFDLPALLRSILDASRLKAEAKNLFVQYQELSPLPAMVKGDERKLRQVLLNLLDNAIKYTEHGGVTLRVKILDTGYSMLDTGYSMLDTGYSMLDTGYSMLDTGNQHPASSIQHPASSIQHPVTSIQFEVEDTGIGISDEQMQAIFEPFTRGDSRPTEGIGLGLAICRKLVELMGGKLSVTSEVGKGSTFTVEVELEVAEAWEIEEKVPENAVMGYHGERKRVLIVDDHITNLAMLVSTLEPLGFEIETATSGEEAVHKAAATPPDLILLDLLMSGMDGHETLRRLRRTEDLDQIKVIGVSAAVAGKARVEAFAAACDAFMAKPVDIGELLVTLQAQLQLDWIEEKAEAAMAPASTELLPVDEGKPQKWPPQPVVDDILEKTEWGDFTRLEKILDRLEGEDKAYSGFCDKLRAYAGQFDDDAIINYLSQ